ncbi:MAG: beta strand repeat-containing protein [Thermomicrobiales bacterium]
MASVFPRAPRRVLLGLLAGALACLCWLNFTPPALVAAANTLHVTDCGDAGPTTLRGMIGSAGVGDTIVFDQNCTITLATGTGTLTLTKQVTIDGTGRTVTVDGGCTLNGGVCTSGGVEVFQVNSGVTASLSNLTIQHGNNIGGAGIANLGTLSVTNSTISDNNGTSGPGGGIFNGINSTLRVTNSTISRNSAVQGGGIGIDSGGTVAMTNSTLSGNTATSDGGGIFVNGGTVTVTNSTLSGNSAGGGGAGGIGRAGGTITLTNTIVAANTTTGNAPDLGGAIATGGHNLFGTTSGATITLGPGDIVNPNPLLGALGNNGGPTQTIPLLIGSPAIGNGNATVCANTAGTAPVAGKDQRGFPRPAARCAIGAFEPPPTYTVGSTSDTGAAATLAVCLDPTNTTCRLRDAIIYAASGLDVIQFNSNGRGTITLSGGTLTKDVTITGPTSGAGVVVDGGCAFSAGACTGGGVQVFGVNPGVTVSLSNLTIQHGNNAGSVGGGIDNHGTVAVTNSTLTGNSATVGGGIVNNGVMTVTNSTIAGNSAVGGAGIASSGTLSVTNSTISGNSATASGGGGIGRAGGTVTLTNTIVAGNTITTGPGPDLSGTITSGGHNLIGTIAGSTGITNGVNGDIVNPNPLLGALGSNGGTTQTFALLTGSPAIGNGNATVCANTAGTAPVAGKDQRGVARPADLCAIGAFEPLLSAISLSSGPAAGGARVTLTGAGYVAGATVSIGGASCTNVQVVNSTKLTCTTGVHGAGAVDVVVTVGSATATLPGGYTYGVIAPLPGPQLPGGTPGSPVPLPGSRPAGTTGGPAPNPLPPPRP